jgi:hypothetical protein
MRILRTMPSVAAACGLTLFAVAAVKAQEAPPPPTSASAAHGQPAPERRGVMLDRMQHRHAEHLRLLHDALSIRPEQENVWQAFAASMTPQPGAWEHERKGEGEEGHRLTTPERLDREVERAQAGLAALQRHAAAVKALYAALSPTQQRTFDALVELHGGFHGGFHGPHGGPGMMGGMHGPMGPDGGPGRG